MDSVCPIYGVQKMLGEYESLDKLNYLAALIDELSLSDQEKLVAIMEAGCDEVSDIDDLINLTFNLDCYDIIIANFTVNLDFQSDTSFIWV